MTSTESKRLAKLRQGFEGSLGKWQKLLTQPVPNDEEYKRAYRETDGRYPGLRGRVTGDGTEGVLAVVLAKEFPTLNREMPDALQELLNELFEKVSVSSKAEFELIVAENGLQDKLLRLEQMEEELKRAQADGTAELPPPLAMSPEDEMRGPAMEAKSNYEQALQAELQKLQSKNEETESQVVALDARARRVLETIKARAGVISRLAEAARAAGLTGDEEDGQDQDDADGSAAGSAAS